MPKHTPGPWEVRHGVGINPRYPWRVATGGYCVCTDVAHTGGGASQQEANARLIAAAPDLLNVAQMLIEAEREASTDDTFRLKVSIVCEFARAAIAKAEGREP